MLDLLFAVVELLVELFDLLAQGSVLFGEDQVGLLVGEELVFEVLRILISCKGILLLLHLFLLALSMITILLLLTPSLSLGDLLLLTHHLNNTILIPL